MGARKPNFVAFLQLFTEKFACSPPVPKTGAGIGGVVLDNEVDRRLLRRVDRCVRPTQVLHRNLEIRVAVPELQALRGVLAQQLHMLTRLQSAAVALPPEEPGEVKLQVIEGAADLLPTSENQPFGSRLDVARVPGIEQWGGGEELETQAQAKPHQNHHGSRRIVQHFRAAACWPGRIKGKLDGDAKADPQDILVQTIDSCAVDEDLKKLHLDEEARAPKHETADPALPKAPKVGHVACAG
mmetsp:Transcript_109159/g.260451  ORF Transcript_109159/g.260451 Transcript_109159/m.260451 type:complete len:241 (-) Transcript_109159:173-895(-)